MGINVSFKETSEQKKIIQLRHGSKQVDNYLVIVYRNKYLPRVTKLRPVR